jgi:hypothetical protein
MPIAREIQTLKGSPLIKVEARKRIRARRRDDRVVDGTTIRSACCDAILFRGGPMSHGAIALNWRKLSPIHRIVSAVRLNAREWNSGSVDRNRHFVRDNASRRKIVTRSRTNR